MSEESPVPPHGTTVPVAPRLDRGDIDGAIDDATRAVAADPDSAEAKTLIEALRAAPR